MLVSYCPIFEMVVFHLIASVACGPTVGRSVGGCGDWGAVGDKVIGLCVLIGPIAQLVRAWV